MQLSWALRVIASTILNLEKSFLYYTMKSADPILLSVILVDRQDVVASVEKVYSDNE